MKKNMILPITIILTSFIALGGCSDNQPPTEAPDKKVEKVKDGQNASESVSVEKSMEKKAEQASEEATATSQEVSDVKKLKEHLQEQEDTIGTLTAERDYYKQYVKDITLTLPPEKIQQLIDKERTYTLTVNRVQFPKDGIMEISQGDFELVLEEEKVPYSVLPEEESIKGKIPSDITQSLTVQAPADKSSSLTNEENGKQSIIYSFKGMVADDVVKITISEHLTKKLNMTTKELEIRVVE